MSKRKRSEIGRVCLTCGKSFWVRKIVVQNGGGKYCSRKCHYKSGAPRPGERTGEIRFCKQCGGEFYVQRCHLVRNRAKYCSRKCKGVGSRKGIRKCAVCGGEFYCKGNPSNVGICCSRECGGTYRRTGKQIECEVCGESVYKSKCYIALKHKHYFCSLGCANRFQKRTKIEYVCLTCGEKFYWSPSRIRQTNPKYCSIPCRNADKKHMTNTAVSACISLQKRKGPTSLEVAGRRLLEEMGLCWHVDFEEQVLVEGRALVDVLFSKCKTIIQWDGDFWHGNPNKYAVLSLLQDKQSKKDKRQDDYLKKNGFEILRFWETDVKNSPSLVKDKIAKTRIHYFQCLGKKGLK